MSEAMCPETGPDGTRRARDIPGGFGAGLAQRSEPERSGGERSGASPAPKPPPPNDDTAGDVSSPPNHSGLAAQDAEAGPDADDVWRDISGAPPAPPLSGHGGRRQGRGRRLVKKDDEKARVMTPQQRLLLLDTWQRSGLPAGDFAAMVGLSKHTLYGWKKRFDAEGPAGLMDMPRGGA